MKTKKESIYVDSLLLVRIKNYQELLIQKTETFIPIYKIVERALNEFLEKPEIKFYTEKDFNLEETTYRGSSYKTHRDNYKSKKQAALV